MKKRMLLLVIILLIVIGGAFAQEKERTNSTITLGVGILSAAFNYEYNFNRYLSVMADVSCNTLLFAYEYTASGKGRWYPFGRAFYLELGLGYVYGKGIGGMLADMLLGTMTLGLYFLAVEDWQKRFESGGLLVQPGLGWKIDIGKRGGFVLPINMGLDIKINKETPDAMPFLRIGLGYSF